MSGNLSAIPLFLFTLFIFSFLNRINGAAEGNILYNGQYLYANNYLQYKSYYLVMQRDCNLVLYENKDRIIWASNTGGRATNCACIMQSDGNLVIYDNGKPIWASNTGGPQGYFVLVLQGDRNVVIYGGPARWATNTAARGGVGAGSAFNVTSLGQNVVSGLVVNETSSM